MKRSGELGSPFFWILIMKKTLLITASLALSSNSLSAAISHKSIEKEQLGYSYGYVMGRTNAETLKEMDLNAFIKGLKMGAAGQKSELKDEDMAKALTQFKKNNEAKQLEAFKKIAAETLKEGQLFLANNAQKENIETRPSGLQYQILKQGTGKAPTANAKVTVNYEGRLIDGTVFDSSIARNQTAEFNLNQVIPAWTEGLQLMKEGAKYRFFVPPQLAYGELGSGDAIKPNSVLIFDVELIQVN